MWKKSCRRLIGDTPAHQALRLVRLATGFGRRAAQTGVRNVAEYLAHERGDLVPRAEAEDFYRGVERLREDLDRSKHERGCWITREGEIPR